MSNRAYAKSQAQQKTLARSLTGSRLLQRTCACGQHTIGDAKCPTCQSEPSVLLRSHRASMSPSASTPTPENTPSLYSGSDRPSHFGYDFSQIPIYPTQRSALQRKASSTSLQGKPAASQPNDANEHEAEAQAATAAEGGKVAESTLSPHPTGETDHLTSPRFAGNEKLEACYQDKDRLREGDHGEAVVKIQQALLDLAYNLGTTGENYDGVDGAYGPKTAAAIRSFKADNQLGSEQYGDVGPGTMHHLDLLFQTTPSQPAVASSIDESPTCPFNNEAAVQDAIEQVAPHGLLAASVPDQAGPSQVGTPPGHLSIERSVALFKQKVNVTIPQSSSSQENLSEGGQFFWTDHVTSDIWAELNSMSSDPTATSFADLAKETVNAITKHEKEGLLDKRIAALKHIAKTTKSPQKSRMLALLRKSPASGDIIVGYLWDVLNKDPRSLMPNLDLYRSIPTLREMYSYSSSSCGTTAHKLVERLKKHGGMKPLDTNAPIVSQELDTGMARRDRRPGPDPQTLLGDIIGQRGVGSTVAQMKLALDGGRQLHARVLSGVGYGTEPDVKPDPSAKPYNLGPPREEHSLIIIGYDGDAFVFSDPDAHVSHTPEGGFGILFFDSTGNRLSTAQNQSDLYVTSDGKHKPAGQRKASDKRYQVIRIVTF